MKTLYSVVVYDNTRDRIDHEYYFFDTLEEARELQCDLGPDDEFVALVAAYSIDDCSVQYV
jgi:hypothetical protein